jgi:hypothetical protein
MNQSEREIAEAQGRLNAVLRKAEALKTEGKTDGERTAAAAAVSRIRARLVELSRRGSGQAPSTKPQGATRWSRPTGRKPAELLDVVFGVLVLLSFTMLAVLGLVLVL